MSRTMVCVPHLVEDVESALRDAEIARDLGADLIEWRVDRIAARMDPTDLATGVGRLIAGSALPSIVTCRSVGEGGWFTGSGADLASLLDQLDPGAEGVGAHIDVELDMLERSPDLRGAIERRTHDEEPRRQRLILSHHDLDARPARLYELVGSMRSHDEARVLKLAWTGRSLRDNLEAFELLQERDRPMIALVMGEAGLMSRVLSAKFGGFLTFASLQNDSATAPGQPTLRELLDLYRFRAIGPATKTFGIVGWPVTHSLSPHVHNAAFDACEVDGVYMPMPVAPGWEPFKATVLSMLDFSPLDLRGLSVTSPHKEHLVRLAREDDSRRWSIDPLADQLGAANTLVVDDEGSCRVVNTDVAGIVEPLRICVAEQGESLAGKSAAIIGAGGVARAAAAGLAIEGARVRIHARTAAQARKLAHELSKSLTASLERSGGTITEAAWDERGRPDREILVNCTPIGMAGRADAGGRWLEDHELDRLKTGAERTVVFDTVYRPFVTPTLEAAETRELRVITGLSMFVEQACRQFELWTGVAPAKGLLERVARETPQAPQA